jgi:dTDP-4-dehydrorhamnose reductase
MILLSGSNGLLGTVLKKYFDKKKIIYSTVGRKNCNFNGDIQNNSFVEKTIKTLQPSIFINLAAITDVDFCETNQEITYKINTEFPSLVSRTLKLSKKKYYIIQVSTDQVYDGGGPHEELATNPTNYYSKTKLETDKILLNYNSISLRTNFFGKAYNNKRLSFSDKIYDSCVKKTEFNVFNDVYFSPVSFNTIFYVINNLIKKQLNGIYNLGTREGMSKKEFALYFCKCLNLDSKNIVGNPQNKVNLIAKRPKDMRLNSKKLENDLGMKFKNLKDEIKSIKVEYIKC